MKDGSAAEADGGAPGRKRERLLADGGREGAQRKARDWRVCVRLARYREVIGPSSRGAVAVKMG